MPGYLEGQRCQDTWRGRGVPQGDGQTPPPGLSPPSPRPEGETVLLLTILHRLCIQTNQPNQEAVKTHNPADQCCLWQLTDRGEVVDLNNLEACMPLLPRHLATLQQLAVQGHHLRDGPGGHAAARGCEESFTP